ncbi:MAG: hypothetical protein HC836_22745 [Richelia sp. RM2_1_2]|nr:hypothetical protein [Richelia sp. RM2_1_2]
MLPTYAPLQITYDRNVLLSELLIACSPYLKNTALFRKPARRYHEEGKKYNLSVCSDEELEQLTLHYLNESGNRCESIGAYNSWQTMNLTYHPADEETKWINHRKIGNAQPVPLRELHPEAWEWREEITNNIPVLKSIINDLEFKYINQLRLLIMHPPSFAGLHIDSYSDTEFFNKGFTAITLNIDSGGGDLVFLSKNNTPSKTDSSILAWHFIDNCLHGVTKCNGIRVQLRIIGKTTISKYKALMNLDKAIW